MANTSHTRSNVKQKELTLKTRLNHAIRPQDDFFEYVNGNWLKANPIPDDERKWGTFYKLGVEAKDAMRQIYEDLQSLESAKPGSLEQQLRDLYFTGMQFDTFESKHIELINDYFALIDAANSNTDLSKTIGTLHALGANAPWRLTLDADDKNSLAHILRFDQSGLSLPDRDYYLEDTPKMKNIRKAYKAHLKEVHSCFPNLGPTAEAFSEAVYEFEEKLARISRTSVELRDIDKNYNKISYKDLRTRYKNIDWPAYAKSCTWKPDDKICINQPEFMEFINQQFTTLPIESWRMYLKWQLLAPYYGRISERFASLKFGFFGKVLNGLKEQQPLWKRVCALLDDAMGEAAGQLYVKKYFSESSKVKVLKMVEELRHAYSERISNLEWMGKGAKKEALKKLSGFKVLVGYPDKWRSFSGLKIGRDSYIKNLIEAERFNNKYYLELLHKPVSRDEWHMSPQTVNAYHDFNRRVVCFPAAILQPPFFDPKAPDAANYGAIGSVIGHELTHGFDDQGCQFDSEGNARTWQTDDERGRFNERAKLIIDQANKFEVVPGLTMKGDLVIGEAIADLGGLEIAYDAYVRSLGKVPSLNESQAFFISFAVGECGVAREEVARMYALIDPHPANKFRVNAMLGHIEAFYQTYELKPGDKLYRSPKQRAKIW